MTSEEENTFRALKGEELLVTSRWCWWGFHKWTKWAERKHHKDWREEYVIMMKHCIHCNDFKERKKYLKT
jgi:hypothetical protein